MATSTPTAATQQFTASRIIIHTPKNFNATVNKLYSSIGRPEDAQWRELASGITKYDEGAKEIFISSVEKVAGPHGFMIFQEYNHGAWTAIFLPQPPSGPLGLKRIIVGNPLTAITMLRHDRTAGIHVPIELLVQEKTEEEGGGTDLVYFLPSALIAGGRRDSNLEEAARALDDKFRNLVQWVAEE